jgi:hypothetical protein
MRRIGIRYYCWLCACLLLFAACEDMHDVTDASQSTTAQTDGETKAMYVLSEGLLNLNNSSMARFSYDDGSLVTSYFTSINKRGLGDTANDMLLYGGKMYVVVDVSSDVEVLDFSTGKSLARISIVKDNGSSREPRYISFAKGKAYVCSYDGTVERIDTTSLAIDGMVAVGRNPDGICTANGKLYVSNSGGLDANGIGVDNSVSVIDLTSFTETKRIEVGPNPGKIAAAEDGTVYVVTRGKDINTGDYHLVAIDSQTDTVTRTYDTPVLNFALQGNIAYVYQYNYSTKSSDISILNLRNGAVIRNQFITDGTTVTTPYAIAVNPYSGNVYIADAYDYKTKGDVLCFSTEGKLLFRLKDIGLNPNTIVFTNQNTEKGSNGGSIAFDYAYADSVLEYKPAPCQFMNTTVTAYQDGYTSDKVLQLATTIIKEKSLLSLGAFGGYVVLGFNHTVKHVAGEYDFKVYGNAYFNLANNKQSRDGGSSEPGIVWVSQDTNGNGKADDEWYELAGSEYGKSTETRNYSITYYRPSDQKGDVKWTDNQGNAGYVYRNVYHTQSSYYPLWMPDTITFTGTRLADNAYNEGTSASQYWVGYAYDWGYADNYPNTRDGSSFKIDWAVDSHGNKVNLSGIDFVKITTAVNESCGQMGEISTEVMTVKDLHYGN